MPTLPWWLPFGAVPEVACLTLATRLDAAEPIQLLDVRTRTEWARGHIVGAINTPITDLRGILDRLELDRTLPLVAICRTAHRSIPAVRLLHRFGYKEAVQLQGGMVAWWAAGFSTRTDDESGA